MNKKIYRELKKVKNHLDLIQNLTDDELKEKTKEFKARIENGVSTEKLLPEAFAVVCEADKRVLGMCPYDVQILGGIALHYCYLAEMNTGEGKTLTATMPLYLNALTGKSSMLVTANEYLADRDAQEMGPVYEFLGLTVKSGVNVNPEKQFSNEEKKEIYNADIVYTTHGALGFDYLLNNLVKKAEDRFLREFYFVIIDEADSVLLDAAQMPLVISGAPRVQSNLYAMTDFFVTTLQKDRDYIEEEQKVWLTDEGVAYAERFFGIESFYSAENFEINRHVVLALRSHILFEREKDYMISEKNEIILLDNGTGRSLPGMKLRGGQHQALEAKEKINISQENRSVASITFQNLFLMFPKFSGMSGTIADAKKELKKIYKKNIVIIPPNKPLMRQDLKDKFYKNAELQYHEAVEDVLERHAIGQPVLVVTSTIADTELFSRLLVGYKVPHNVLNANNAYWEAQIIKEAGQRDAVTVSTGMAGRGTDIRLGDGVEEIGGLAVIGVGRMSNTRLERQTRGRAGRQGDHGISQFYVSLEDEVVSSIGEKKLEKYADQDKRLSKRRLIHMINGSQKLSEELAVSQRQNAVDFDKVMKRQRTIMYETRNNLLDGMSLDEAGVKKIIKRTIKHFVKSTRHISNRDINRYVLDNLSYNLDKDVINIKRRGKWRISKTLFAYAEELFEERRQMFGDEDLFKEYIRRCALKAIDNAWVEQVDYLQQLQYAVSGRTSLQRNLVYEYQSEAYESFYGMERDVIKDITRNIFLSEVQFGAGNEMNIIFP